MRSAFQPEAQKEADTLQEYASKQGLDDSLKMWDVDFYQRKQRDEMFEWVAYCFFLDFMLIFWSCFISLL